VRCKDVAVFKEYMPAKAGLNVSYNVFRAFFIGFIHNKYAIAFRKA
jgi:hypothetical protein